MVGTEVTGKFVIMVACVEGDIVGSNVIVSLVATGAIVNGDTMGGAGIVGGGVDIETLGCAIVNVVIVVGVLVLGFSLSPSSCSSTSFFQILFGLVDPDDIIDTMATPLTDVLASRKGDDPRGD